MWLNLNQISKTPMKINKQKLVELLVEKTSMEEEEVKSQLDQLIERIIDAAKRGKALEIREFGLFYFDEAGELKFDPSDELSTEISFKYAGMKPVELKPERDTSFPVAEEEDDLEDFDFLSDITGDDSDIYAGTEEEQDVFAPEEKPAEKKKTTTLKSPRLQAKRRSGSLMWVFAAVVGVAILVLAYLYFIGSLATSTQEQSPAVTQVDPEPFSDMDEDEQTTSTDVNDGSEQDETEPENEASETADPEIEAESSVEPPEEIIPVDPAEPEEETDVSNVDQPLYGLRGSVVEEANSGYSIVLHSFPEEETARATSADLTRQDYRSIVTSRTVADRTMWRVSIGQFETLQDAQQAAQDLPEPYNTQNFIQRIQIN